MLKKKKEQYLKIYKKVDYFNKYVISLNHYYKNTNGRYWINYK